MSVLAPIDIYKNFDFIEFTEFEILTIDTINTYLAHCGSLWQGVYLKNYYTKLMNF